MSETDAENRNVGLEEFRDRIDRVRAGLGIAGTIRQEDALGIHFEHALGRRLRRYHGDTTSLIGHAAQNAALDAEVVCNDVQALPGTRLRALLEPPVRPFVPLIHALRRYDLREVHAFQARESASSMHRRVCIDFLARHDAAGERTFLAENARELACVDLRDRDDLAAL